MSGPTQETSVSNVRSFNRFGAISIFNTWLTGSLRTLTKTDTRSEEIITSATDFVQLAEIKMQQLLQQKLKKRETDSQFFDT